MSRTGTLAIEVALEITVEAPVEGPVVAPVEVVVRTPAKVATKVAVGAPTKGVAVVEAAERALSTGGRRGGCR